MNSVVLVGRLTKDPELRTTQSGVSVCSFTVACDRRYTQDGKREADFINCIAWRQSGEFVSRYFTKGNRIALEGSIQTRSWDDQNGNKRYATEVVVDHAEFAQSKSELTQSGDRTYQEATGSAVPYMPQATVGDVNGFMPEDDDLPF